MIVIYRGLSIECVMIRNNFFIPIIMIALIFGGVGITQAFAHTDPVPSAPGVSASIPIVIPTTITQIFSGVDGDMIEIFMRLQVQNSGNDPALDGGTIVITGPASFGTAGSATTNEPGGPIVPCIDGDENDGDLIGPEDCDGSPTSFDGARAEYTLDCDEATDSDQDPDTPLVIEFEGVYDGFSHRNTADNRVAGANVGNEIDCLPDYTIETDSTPDDKPVIFDDLPVNNPSDLVTITGTDGLSGTFVVTAVLTGPSGAVDTPICPDAVSIGAGHTYPITSTCTTSGVMLDEDDFGDYCWSVTVTETSGNYNDAVFTHDGCPDEEDDPREQFIINPDYGITTKSEPKGVVPFEAGDVTTASDTITINGQTDVTGNFDVTKADLVNDDTSIIIGSLGGDVSCVVDPTNTSTFPAFILCTWTGTALDPGNYCWDITVEDLLGNYDPAEVSHNGCDETGTMPQNDSDEQFIIPTPFAILTTSSLTGTLELGDLPVTEISDTITIDGVNSEAGEFQGTGELILIGSGAVAGTVECLPDTHDIDQFPDSQMVCTWSNGVIELVPGDYCWDITVEDTLGNYVPATASHNGCPVGTGEDPKDDPEEQFMFGEFRGCTPGFWKGNEKGKTEACQWVVEDPGDFVKDVFDVSNPGDNDTLIDALKYKGGNCASGGTERQMLRMAVAAKLNIEADIGYEIASVDDLKTLVNTALGTVGEDARCAAMKTVHGLLGEFNEGPDDFEEQNEGESFCPLSNSVNACPTD